MAGIAFVLGMGVFFICHTTEFAHEDEAAKRRERVPRSAQLPVGGPARDHPVAAPHALGLP